MQVGMYTVRRLYLLRPKRVLTGRYAELYDKPKNGHLSGTSANKIIKGLLYKLTCRY